MKQESSLCFAVLMSMQNQPSTSMGFCALLLVRSCHTPYQHTLSATSAEDKLNQLQIHSEALDDLEEFPTTEMTDCRERVEVSET